MMIVVDESRHTYTDYATGQVIPHVTEILRAAGVLPDLSKVPQARLAHACSRGIKAHAAAHYLAEDDLDDASLDPEIYDYVAQVERFLRQTQFAVEGCEVIVHSKRYGYCGREDLIGRMAGYRWLINYKFVAAVHRPSVTAQLGGYEIAWNEGNPNRRVDKVAALHVTRKKFQLLEFSVVECESAWLAALGKWSVKK